MAYEGRVTRLRVFGRYEPAEIFFEDGTNTDHTHPRIIGHDGTGEHSGPRIGLFEEKPDLARFVGRVYEACEAADPNMVFEVTVPDGEANGWPEDVAPLLVARPDLVPAETGPEEISF